MSNVRFSIRKMISEADHIMTLLRNEVLGVIRDYSLTERVVLAVIFSKLLRQFAIEHSNEEFVDTLGDNVIEIVKTERVENNENKS